MLPQTSSGRWLAGITVGVFSVIIVAVVVTLVASGDPEPLPVGSPEAAVQDYVQAIDDGDFVTAYAMLSDERRASCGETEFRGQTRNGRDADIRLTLDNVDAIGDHAIVAVRVTSFRGNPPFDFSENTYSALFTVDRVDGTWRINDAPWPFSGCRFQILRPAVTPDATATPLAPKA